MKYLLLVVLALIGGSAFAQNAGTVTNHAFVLGKGAGTTGYTSLLCGSAQLAVGQAAADPICQTITGDVTITSGGVTAIGGNKVTRAMEAQGVARSVIGVTGNATANVADIQGTANQFFGVNSAGTALAFNTMSQDCTLATGVITCTKTNNVAFTAGATAAVGQLPGEPSNGSASAGNVGEYVNSTLSVGSAVALTTSTAANITSISLTAGDWDVWGAIANQPAAGTAYTLMIAAINTVSATIPANIGAPGRADSAFGAGLTGGNTSLVSILPMRMSLSATTTVFLIADDFFSGGTMSAYGYISARRRR